MSNRAERRAAQRQSNRSGRRVHTSDGEVFEPEFVRSRLLGKRYVVDPAEVPPLPSPAPGGPSGAQPAPSRRSPGEPRRRRGVVDLAVLDAIASAVDERAAAEHLVLERVVAARSAGQSWRAIAEALGVTHEAARKRYGAASGGAQKPKGGAVSGPA